MKAAGSPKTLRKMLNTKTYLAFLALKARYGVKGLQNFVSGKTNSRVPAPVMVGVFVFLESEMYKESIPRTNDMHDRIRGVYGDAFTSVFKNRPTLTNKAHGGMYHLLKIAQLHMESKGIGKPLLAVEAPRYIQLVSANGKEFGDRYERRLDAILGSSSEQEYWYEFKSYKSGKDLSSSFSVWQPEGGAGRAKPGRQILLDRIALAAVYKPNSVSTDDVGDNRVKVSQINWLFQRFAVRAKAGFPSERSITPAEFGDNGLSKGTVLYYLARLANTNKDSVALASLGYKLATENDAFAANQIANIARIDNVKNWIKSNAKNLLNDVSDEVLAEILAEVEEVL